MTVEAVQVPDPRQPMTDDDLTAYTTWLARECAPRRFLLVGVAPDRGDAGVLGWGLSWDDRALIYLEAPDADRPSLYLARSAESTRASLAMHHDVRLYWVDPGT